jgi:hypothetical protein
MVFLNLVKLIRLPIQNSNLSYSLYYTSKILHYLSQEILAVLSKPGLTGNCWAHISKTEEEASFR